MRAYFVGVSFCFHRNWIVLTLSNIFDSIFNKFCSYQRTDYVKLLSFCVNSKLKLLVQEKLLNIFNVLRNSMQILSTHFKRSGILLHTWRKPVHLIWKTQRNCAQFINNTFWVLFSLGFSVFFFKLSFAKIWELFSCCWNSHASLSYYLPFKLVRFWYCLIKTPILFIFRQ